MTRLPDTYFSGMTIPEQPYELSPKQPSPIVYQGEDAVFTVYLSYLGVPVSFDAHELSVIVKKNAWASNVLWEGIPLNGLYEEQGTPGYFKVVIPSSAISRFLPGTYSAAIVLKEKFSSSANPVTRYILNFTFAVELSAASPNPKLKAATSTEAVVDLVDRTVSVTITSTEPTVPGHVNITQ